MRSEKFQPLFAVTILLLCFFIRSAFVCQYDSPFLCVCLVFCSDLCLLSLTFSHALRIFLDSLQICDFSELFLKLSGLVFSNVRSVVLSIRSVVSVNVEIIFMVS